MSVLHTTNKSPFQTDVLASCLRHVCAGSAVLMIEDAVYGAARGTAVSEVVQKALLHARLYALSPDLEARGIAVDRLIPGIEVVDYEGFVELAVAHDHVQAWL